MMSNHFYTLFSEDDKWIIFDSIDIYLRRMIEFKKEGKKASNEALLNILKRVIFMFT